MLTAMADPHFRPCRPGDIDAALPLIISSGPEAFGYVFNDQREDQLAAFLVVPSLRAQGPLDW